MRQTVPSDRGELPRASAIEQYCEQQEARSGGLHRRREQSTVGASSPQILSASEISPDGEVLLNASPR